MHPKLQVGNIICPTAEKNGWEKITAITQLVSQSILMVIFILIAVRTAYCGSKFDHVIFLSSLMAFSCAC